MKNLRDKLLETNMLHTPLPLKDIPDQKLKNMNLFPLTTKDTQWKHKNRGAIYNVGPNGVRLVSDTRYDSWPKDEPQDGDYIQYGHVTADLNLEHEDWQKYNYLQLEIESNCENVINPNVTIQFFNEGKIKIPDKYFREGIHNINIGKSKKKIFKLDISNLPRDAITKVRIDVAANGSYMNLAGKVDLTVTNLKLANSLTENTVHGWQPKEKFIFPQIGFSTDASKTILTTIQNQKEYKLIDKSKHIIKVDKIRYLNNKLVKNIGIIDFSDCKTNGTYQVVVGNEKSPFFKIESEINRLSESILDELNFIYSERCGYPVPGIHGTCHVDTIGQHDNKKIVFNGGWHDAGDLSQQTLHTGEVALSLARTARKMIETFPLLAQRLYEESEWGLDFAIKMRFGDGYRVTSAGVSRWTNNQISDMDDSKARVHNNPYDNFLFAAIFSEAAKCFKNNVYQKQLLQVAKEDFNFAIEEFDKNPYEKEPIMWEHTYNTSNCIYNATIVFAAGSLYKTTKKENYLEICQSFGKKLLACQETTNEIRDKDGQVHKGMFYRDETHKVFQHFNHQAREHLIAEALRKLIEIDPENDLWLNAAKLYKDYLLDNIYHTYPYNMFSSGFYKINEYQDKESFNRQNLLIDDSAIDDYRKQLKDAEIINKDIYFKKFPVWFSFRGNNAILLSMGRSAAIIGSLLKDKRLLEAGREQLEWISGFNPFGQSLIYGLGDRFDSEYASSSGEQMGEIPVGIETKENEDVPYWPHFNNATYKEVWISNAGQWLSLVSELI